MRVKLVTAVMVGAMALTACQTTGGGYGGGGTRLSQCTRNALIGAGIGAIVGAAQDSRNNRAENAALGAAVGGAATYGVCRVLSAREQQRVENAYYQSLNSGAPVNDSWQSDQGAPRSLAVSSPQPVAGRPECRTVAATVNDQQYGNQQLPAETFCRNGAGQWVPA